MNSIKRSSKANMFALFVDLDKKPLSQLFLKELYSSRLMSSLLLLLLFLHRKLEKMVPSSQPDVNLKYLTGEWFYEAKSRRHNDKIHGSEIILAAMKQGKTSSVGVLKKEAWFESTSVYCWSHLTLINGVYKPACFWCFQTFIPPPYRCVSKTGQIQDTWQSGLKYPSSAQTDQMF